MARQAIDRLTINSSAEEIIQSFRRWSIQNGTPSYRMPVHDFGRFLDERSEDFIGIENSRTLVKAYRETVSGRTRLPFERCAFLSRLHSADQDDNILLFVGTDISETLLQVFTFDAKYGWTFLAQSLERDTDAELNIRMVETKTRISDQDIADMRAAFASNLQAMLYLIYERGGSVETIPRPPSVTKGRSKLHPLAPSSVITIRIDRPRLLQTFTAKPVEPEPTGEQRTILKRRGGPVRYRSARYINVRGTTGFRRGFDKTSESDPIPIYEIKQDEDKS